MTITSSESQVRSHRLWAILVTTLAVITAGYFVWVFLFASIHLPNEYASVDPFLNADLPPIADQGFFAFEQEVYKDLGDGREISLADLLRVGNLTYSNGDPARASHYFREALNRSRAANSDLHVVLAMNNLGISETARGDTEEAERNLLGAYDLARNFVSDQVGVAELSHRIMLNVGWFFLQTAEYAEAQMKYRAVEEVLADATNQIELGLSWSGQGRAATGLLEFTQAIAFHQQAMVLFGKMKNYRAQAGEIYYMGQAELASGDYESARETFSEAVHVYMDRARDWVGALRGKAALGKSVEAAGQLYQALRYATEVMEEYRDRGHKIGDVLTRIEVARIEERRSKFETAIEHYKKASQRLDQCQLVCRKQEVTDALARLGTGKQADNEIR